MSQQINLFSPVFLTPKPYFSAATILQSAIAVVVGLAALGSFMHWRLGALEAQSAAVKAQTERTTRQIEALRAGSPRTGDPMLPAAILEAQQRLGALADARAAIASGQLGAQLGFSSHFRALARQALDGVWLTSFALGGDGRQLTLEGRSLDPKHVPEYLDRLKREPLFQGIAFDHFSMSEPSGGATAGGADAGNSISFRIASAKDVAKVPETP